MSDAIHRRARAAPALAARCAAFVSVARRAALASVAFCALAGISAFGLAGAVRAGEVPERDLDTAQSLAAILAAKGRVAESERLRQLFEVAWREALREAPELATAFGVPGYDDRWADLSAAAIARRRALLPRILAAAESIDPASLTTVERTDSDLFLRRARQDLAGARFPEELLAIDQLGGVQQDVPFVLANMPAGSVAQYENIVARLRGVPRLIDQTMALLERGLAVGVTPPRVALRDVPGQVTALLAEDPFASPLLAAFHSFPAAVAAADQQRLRREAAGVFVEQVAPAFLRLRAFLETTYLPRARESIAMSALPDGQAWYELRVREATTTELTPRRVHELGLAEVGRIRGEMSAQAARIGWKGSLTELERFLRSDRQFFFDRPEDLLAAYRDICKRIDPQLVKLFGKLPRLPYGVSPMPGNAGSSQTVAYYDSGSIAAAKPGIFYVNTYDLESHPKWRMEALALHEAVPGHHIQLSLALEREGVPEWRRFDSYAAFSEGWGLYAEGLGAEIGMYQDPYAKYGQLTNEMWRAIRMVVDTGIHVMGWSRQQAMDYCRANSAESDHVITLEVDRYIVQPGWSVAYKVGELEIKRLRAYAEKELGDKFDLRAFHDQLLGRGALPLDVLDAGIKEWVQSRRGPH